MPVFNPLSAEGVVLAQPEPSEDRLARVPFLDAESFARALVRQDVVQEPLSIERLEHQASDGAEIGVEMNLGKKNNISTSPFEFEESSPPSGRRKSTR